jgi:hypothetical protein
MRPHVLAKSAAAVRLCSAKGHTSAVMAPHSHARMCYQGAATIECTVSHHSVSSWRANLAKQTMRSSAPTRRAMPVLLSIQLTHVS